MGVWPNRDPLRSKKSYYCTPDVCGAFRAVALEFFKSKRLWQQDKWGGFVNIEMSRVIKDFENSRSVAEHLSRGQIVHLICLGVHPQTLVTKSILREKFRVFNNNILSIHLELQNGWEMRAGFTCISYCSPCE